MLKILDVSHAFNLQHRPGIALRLPRAITTGSSMRLTIVEIAKLAKQLQNQNESQDSRCFCV